MATKKRDYKKEYRDFGGTPEQIKRRAGRNKARREAMKAGLVKKGDGKEVDHKNFNPLDDRAKNKRVISRHANRIRQPKRS